MDIWKVQVRKEMDSEKGQLKVRLLDWGCAMERCKRIQDRLRRLEELEKDSFLEKEYAEERERLEADLQEIWSEKRQMDVLLEGLEENEQEYIRLRFEKGYSFVYIGRKLYLSRASIFRMQDRILEKLLQAEK
nr:sigma factor-like helix-turn-helix DNA-binding protein [uncultured Anaerotignum sp.]